MSVIVESEQPAGVRSSPWSSFAPAPEAVLVVVLVASLLARLLWLTLPARTLIFDETYYVNAARVMLGIPVPKGVPYSGMPKGKDPNHEHPPLGKVFIAASMRLFGDDAYGWRMPSIVAGMASILLLYLIVLAGGGRQWLGVLAATLFSADNLVLVHSRIGTLDMPLVALGLLGVWAFLKDKPLLAGVAVGAATLVKLNGVYALLALLLMLGVRALWQWRAGIRPLLELRAAGLLLLGFVPAFAGGLWVLDLAVTPYHFPWDHLHYMLRYGFSLSRPGGPANDESYPWQWIFNEVQMTYLRVDQEIKVGGSVVAARPLIYFRGAMNPIIIGTASIGIAYASWRAWRLRDQLSLWAVLWAAANYLPYYPLSMLEHRTSYIFYFLPVMPAVAVSLAQVLMETGLPKVVPWGYVVAVLVGAFGYYPFHTLTPR